MECLVKEIVFRQWLRFFLGKSQEAPGSVPSLAKVGSRNLDDLPGCLDAVGVSDRMDPHKNDDQQGQVDVEVPPYE